MTDGKSESPRGSLGPVALLLALAILLGLSVAAEPAASQPRDPRVAGPHGWTKSLYDFGTTTVDDPEFGGFSYEAAVRGSLHVPAASAAGPRPLVLLMHGRHTTCGVLGVTTCGVLGVEIIGTYECPSTPATGPVESFDGYDALATNLASWGYVVASMDANHINDRDLLGDAGANARGQLLLASLDEFSSISTTGKATSGDDAGEAAALLGRVDLDRVGVMGHSRGGQGVANGAAKNAERPDPYGIRAIFALAPTSFDHAVVDQAPFATLLPYCDGDVSNLQGAWMYDNGRRGDHPRHQFLVMGANHNWFNTTWTASDQGSGDPHCGDEEATRLSLAEQVEVGTLVMGAFLRTYVGGEAGFDALLTGASPFPALSDPSTAIDLAADILTSFQPAREDRLSLLTFEARTLPDVGTSGGSLEVTGDPTLCLGEDCEGRTHADAWMLDWAASERETINLTFEALDLRPWDRMCARFGLPPDLNESDAVVDFAISDRRSTATIAVEHRALEVPPGDSEARGVLNMVCVDLTELAGIDLGDVRALQINAQGDRLRFTDWELQDLERLGR